MKKHFKLHGKGRIVRTPTGAIQDTETGLFFGRKRLAKGGRKKKNTERNIHNEKEK